VPGVYIPSPAHHKDEVHATVADGILADVAPTLCHLLGISQPEEMTGHNLITLNG
jgi:bisphosphoglycerate-independent phosphoglycerate mutase (AlkP superfamily)